MDQGRVSIEKNGRTYAGSWRVDRDIITVAASSGTKSRPLGRLAKSPSVMARVLLRELVDESKDSG